MDTQFVMAKIMSVIRDQFRTPEGYVNAKTSFADDLGADSAALAELLIRLEDEFGAPLPDMLFSSNPSVGEVADLLTRILPPVASRQVA